VTATPLLARFSEINLLDAARGRKAVVASIRVALMRAQGAKVVATRPTAETVAVRELEEGFRGRGWRFSHGALRRLKLRRLRDQHRLRVRHFLLRQQLGLGRQPAEGG